MDIYIVYHHSGEVIGVYDDEQFAHAVLMAKAGDGGALEHRILNETVPV